MKNQRPKELRFLVIGSGGGVGRQICTEVVRQCGPKSLVLGDYKLDRARAQAGEFPGSTARLVDIRDDASIQEALSPELTGVIVCTLQEQPRIQIACLKRGIPCLDVTIGHSLVGRILDLDRLAQGAETPLLAMAGMWPGLSGVMAKQAAEMLDRTDAINLALCQSTRSKVGSTGISDMLASFSRPVKFREGGVDRQVPGFSVARRIEYPDPLGTHNHRLVDFVEGPLMARALGVAEVHLWTGFDSAVFDGLVSVLRRVGVCSLFERQALGLQLGRGVNALKNIGPAGPEPTAIVVEASGEKGGRPSLSRVALRGPSDYGVTAMSAVAFARLIASRRSEMAGAGHPLQYFRLSEVVNTINHPDLLLIESGPEVA